MQQTGFASIANTVGEIKRAGTLFFLVLKKWSIKCSDNILEI